MRLLELRLKLPEPDLLDASEALQHLADGETPDCGAPVLHALLQALDDAITDAFATDGAAARAPESSSGSSAARAEHPAPIARSRRR